jgi:hypothetical protein
MSALVKDLSMERNPLKCAKNNTKMEDKARKHWACYSFCNHKNVFLFGVDWGFVKTPVRELER